MSNVMFCNRKLMDKVGRYMHEVYDGHCKKCQKSCHKVGKGGVTYVVNVYGAEDKRRATEFVQRICQQEPKERVDIHIYSDRHYMNDRFNLHPNVHVKVINDGYYRDTGGCGCGTGCGCGYGDGNWVGEGCPVV